MKGINEVMSQFPDAGRLLEAYSPYISAIEQAKGVSIDGIQKLVVASCLENTSQVYRKAYRSIFEDGITQASDIGPYLRANLGLITAVLPNLIAQEIVSIQPMKQSIGYVFGLDYKTGSAKGGVAKGTSLFSHKTTNVESTYTSETVEEEVIQTLVASASVSGSLSWVPIIPGTVTVTIGSVVGTDDGANNITGVGISSGTIDYSTGEITMTLATPASADVSVDYRFDLTYAPGSIPRLELAVTPYDVQARPRKLATIFGFDAAYDFEQQFGLSLENELSVTAAQEIRAEIDHAILNDLYNNAGLTSSWDSTAPDGVAEVDHWRSFLHELRIASNDIYGACKRGTGNFIVTGTDAAAVLESIAGWVASGVNSSGPYYAGNIAGFKVYKNPFWTSQYLVGYKGNGLFEAGYIYAPYLPIISTKLITDYQFQSSKGFATSYATQLINEKFFVAGSVT